MYNNSKIFYDFIGNNSIKKVLENLIEIDALSTPFLFIGPDGVGKRTLAFKLSQLIFCRKNIKKICNNCSSCINFQKGIYPDFIHIQPPDNKQISIEMIQKAINNLNNTPLYKRKILLITDAEKMTKSAVNALLKTIEENIAKNLIILTSNKEYLLPETIKSRSQILRFSLVSKKEINNFIKHKFNLSEELANNIANLSHGRIGLAVKLIDKEYFQEYDNLVSTFFLLHKSHIVDKIKVLEKNVFKKDRQSIFINLNIWQSLYRDLILIQTNNHQNIVHTKYIPNLKQINQNRSLDKNLKNLKKIILAISLFHKTNVNHKLLIEQLVLDF